MPVKLIAFDLDYTLLDSQKRLSEENRNALTRAAEMGIEIVPATGRVFAGLSESVRRLPTLRWCILGNGARIYDAKNDEVIASAQVTVEDAFRVYDFAESMGIYYDCYLAERGYMNRAWYDSLESFISDEATRAHIRSLRSPVDDLRAFLREKGADSLLKLQLYFKDMELRRRMLDELPRRFPELAFSSSLPMNIEVNNLRANKGEGLRILCGRLGIDLCDTMAFGDGLNDLEMISSAGLGVCMANGDEKLKAEADIITASCDESGVARAIEKYVLGGT